MPASGITCSIFAARLGGSIPAGSRFCLTPANTLGMSRPHIGVRSAVKNRSINRSVTRSSAGVPAIAPRAVRAAPAASVHRFELSADALFAFDQADLQALLPSGRSLLARLIIELQNTEVHSVVVSGYTDSSARRRTTSNYPNGGRGGSQLSDRQRRGTRSGACGGPGCQGSHRRMLRSLEVRHGPLSCAESAGHADRHRGAVSLIRARLDALWRLQRRPEDCPVADLSVVAFGGSRSTSSHSDRPAASYLISRLCHDAGAHRQHRQARLPLSSDARVSSASICMARRRQATTRCSRSIPRWWTRCVNRNC